MKMSPSKLRTLRKEKMDRVCLFCDRYTIDDFNYGPLLNRDGITCHYYCILLSAGLKQNGNDDSDGILGFLIKDICKEARRGSRLRCYICKKKGASIGCSVRTCPRSFHLPCGLEHGANFQFLNNYESFCVTHRKVQAISVDKNSWQCLVCLSKIRETYDPLKRPLTTTCCKTAIFHKHCIQKLALNTGYHFKCPKCNDVSNFVPEMQSMGIFVPERDASWELEDNAYNELVERNFKCDAEICNCPKGRHNSDDEGDWTLAHCQTCAAFGMHQKCGNMAAKDVPDWSCRDCTEVDIKLKQEKLKREQQELELRNFERRRKCKPVTRDCEFCNH